MAAVWTDVSLTSGMTDDQDNWVSQAGQNRRRRLSAPRPRRETTAPSREFVKAGQAFWAALRAEMLRLVALYNVAAGGALIATDNSGARLWLNALDPRSELHVSVDLELEPRLFISTAWHDGSRMHREYPLDVADGEVHVRDWPHEPNPTAVAILEPWIRYVTGEGG
jgi:hypothetical protein